MSLAVSEALWAKAAPAAAQSLTATWSKLFDWVAQQTTSLIKDLTGWKILNNNVEKEVLLPLFVNWGWKVNVEEWQVGNVKRMQLKHNLSLNCNLDPSIPSILIMKQIYQSFVGKFCNNSK